MDNDIIIGIDLAKNVFQLHGARRDGAVLFRKKLTRTQLKKFMSTHAPCLVAMKACGTAHYWAREFSKVGYRVKLIPPIYVQPFVKRQKMMLQTQKQLLRLHSDPTCRLSSLNQLKLRRKQ